MKHAPSMLAGAAEAVITRVKDRPVVYDDLFARALVLGADDDRLVIVATDMGTFSVEYADDLLRRIERTTRYPNRQHHHHHNPDAQCAGR